MCRESCSGVAAEELGFLPPKESSTQLNQGQRRGGKTDGKLLAKLRPRGPGRDGRRWQGVGLVNSWAQVQE